MRIIIHNFHHSFHHRGRRGHRGKIGRKQIILNLVYIHFLLCPSKNRYKLNRKTYYIYFIIQKITTFVV